jgi:phage antirepressor YoqD-like protein
MNELTVPGTMTVREAAEILGVTEEAIRKHIRELWPDLMQKRVTTILNEKQFTEIKGRMRLTTKVVSTITDLEAAEMLIKSAEHFKARFEQEHRLRIEAESNVTALEQKAAADAPKVGYYEALVDRNHLTNFRDTAKEIGIPEKKFISVLEEKGYIYRDSRGRIKPYHDKMDYFAIKDWENEEFTGTQTFITVIGKRHFLRLFGNPLFGQIAEVSA